MSEQNQRRSGYGLMRHSLFLGVVMALANLANILFHVAMGHMLPTAEYGVLMSMVAMIYVLNVPAETLRTAMAYFSAVYHLRKDGHADIARLYATTTRIILLITLPLVLLFSVLSPWLGTLFHIRNIAPLLAVVVVCLATLIMTTLHGILQGTQRFGWYGLSMMLWFWGRLALAVGLVWLGGRALGALVGMAGGAALAVILPFLFLRKLIFSEFAESRQAAGPIIRYILLALMAQGTFMFLGNIDLLAIKHYFAPEAAGRFAQAALFAHFIWLLPLPVVMAMFPKVVQQAVHAASARKLYMKAALLSVLIVVLVGGAVMRYPRHLFIWVFASPNHAMLPYMPFFVLTMTPLAFIYVVINYEMAIGRFTFLFPMCTAVVIACIGVILHHDSYVQVIQIVCWTAWPLCIILAGMSATRAKA